MKHVLLAICVSVFVTGCNTTVAKQSVTVSKPDTNYGRSNNSYSTPKRWTNLNTPLMQISMPQDWQLVQNPQSYLAVTSKNQYRKPIGTPRNLHGCMSHLADFDKHMGGKLHHGVHNSDCMQELRYQQYHRNYKPVIEILKLWSSTNTIKPYRDLDRQYEYIHTWASIVELYASGESQYNLNNSDKKQIEDWIVLNVKNIKLQSYDVNNNTIRPRCTRIVDVMWIDDCGSTRFRYTYLNLMAGLITGNQYLFDEGIDSLQYVTTFYDIDGVYIGMAVRGDAALSYTRDTIYYTSVFVEILNTLGYDYLEHQLPNGKKVHETLGVVFDNAWSDDSSIFWKYAKVDVGRAPFDVHWTDLKLPVQQREVFSENPQTFVRAASRYVFKYRPDIAKRFGYQKTFTGRVGNWKLPKHGIQRGEYGMFQGQAFTDTNALYRTND